MSNVDHILKRTHALFLLVADHQIVQLQWLCQALDYELFAQSNLIHNNVLKGKKLLIRLNFLLPQENVSHELTYIQ